MSNRPKEYLLKMSLANAPRAPQETIKYAEYTNADACAIALYWLLKRVFNAPINMSMQFLSTAPRRRHPL